MNLLRVKKLSKSFGGLKAVQDIDLSIASGEISSLIGPNGAGKDDVFQPAHRRLRAGRGRDRISRASASTWPHVALDREARARPHVSEYSPFQQHDRAGERDGGSPLPDAVGAVLGPAAPSLVLPGGADEISHPSRERLRFVGLHKQAHELAGNLPYGAQRRLEIARALATEPRLLLLDEPTAGMTHMPNPSSSSASSSAFRRKASRFS